MSPTFKALLDEGWTVAGYGSIRERNHPLSKIRNHPLSKIKTRIQIHHKKGRVVKCFTDPDNENFMVAHRLKNLRDYFGSR